MTLSEALEVVFQQTMYTVASRLYNPLWRQLFSWTGKCYGFTEGEKLSDANCLTVREKIRNYVRKRITKEKKSSVGNNSDILSLFLESPDIFTEDIIVDEIIAASRILPRAGSIALIGAWQHLSTI